MPKINLKSEWTFRTIVRTIDFPAGEHEVDAEVHAAAVEEGVIKGNDDGNGASKTGTSGASNSPKG
jgi:hypothetical protein